MSDDLRDEVEAINSIYGDDTLTPSEDDSTTYILRLPGDASSLKVRFPATYPSKPPEVPSTHHSSGGRKGAGARDLELFRAALKSVFQEGLVCVFDAVEEYVRRRDEEAEEYANHEEVEEETHEGEKLQDTVEEDLGQDFPPAEWTVSTPIVENRSTFVAHVARVSSPAQARAYMAQLLASDRRIRDATHNMSAWRIRGGGGESSAVAYQDCDDDGETAAGSRLLHLMQLMDLWDAMVVVTRWYGGVKLGPRRFAVINAAARDGFVRAGMVMVEEKKKGR